MSRVCEPSEASFTTMSFHLSTNCVRNEVGRLRLGGSLLKEALGDVGGPRIHAPYWRPRGNVESMLSIRRGQRQGPALSSVVYGRPLWPTPGPYPRTAMNSSLGTVFTHRSPEWRMWEMVLGSAIHRRSSCSEYHLFRLRPGGRGGRSVF